MPFTLSHSAAVLPVLRSKYFSATGLIIGTMAPDFEYFFRMNVQGIYGHTLWGILYFDVPVSLVLALLFHGVVKKNLIDQLPVFFQSRFQAVRNFDFYSYIRSHKLIFIYSVIIGTATHIIWDGFTHQRQYFVQALPQIYEGTTVPFMGVDYPLWYALQGISTVVGGLLILWYVFRMKQVEGEYNRPGIAYWLLLAVIVAVITYVRMQFAYNNLKYVVTIITACSAFCIGITILGLIPFKWQRSSHSGYR
ncbi:MAG TPA: DUF4184 family protein [Cyclobacteriaceae bacterium]|nr:DUF4184 family protein [Cyclobacteriaceae bacterium]